MQAWEINHQSVGGHRLTRDGAFHPAVPTITGLYETADGVAFCIGFRDDAAWREFCEFAGRPELGVDPRLDTREKRDPFRDRDLIRQVRNLRPIVAELMKQRTAEEWQYFFDVHPDNAMAQRVLNYEEVLEDEQALVNGYIVEKDIPNAGRHKVVGLPVRMSRTPGTAKNFFADLGEHTAELMRELGYNDAAIAAVESHKAPPF